VIRGQLKQEEELKEEAYYRLETAYGTFERFIPLSERFEEGEVEAAYEDWRAALMRSPTLEGGPRDARSRGLPALRSGY
jgi:hypothetical protein